MTLPEIALKLRDILNDSDAPTDIYYEVQTPGFHLDSVAIPANKTNFIPVFISSLGGQNNPVPILKQSEATIPIAFYFPVRFKEKAFAIYDYLVGELCGQYLDWGEHSGKAISNISFPRWGEIQDLDLKEFKHWTDDNFDKPIEVMEPFISMEITLSLSAVGSDFIYGNNVKITSIKAMYGGSTILNDDKPVCIDRAELESSEPAAQQIFDEKYVKGFPSNATYTKQLPLIVKNSSGYFKLLEICEVTKDIQNLRIEITEEIPVQGVLSSEQSGTTPHNLSVTNTYYVANYSRRTSLGQLLGIQFTLALVG